MLFALAFLTFSAQDDETAACKSKSLSNLEKDFFGGAVGSAGDVNRDGYEDLIVGAPHASLTHVREGAAFVFYGSECGLIYTNHTRLVPKESARGDQFGNRVLHHTADFNGDSYADVAVTASYQDDAGERAGAVYVWYGSNRGVDPESEEMLKPEGLGAYEFCCHMTSGNLLGDSADELVLGNDHDKSEGLRNHGSVSVVLGNKEGLEFSTSVRLLPEKPVANGQFGRAVQMIPSWKGDTHALAVGAPGSRTVTIWTPKDGKTFERALTLIGPSTGSTFGWSLESNAKNLFVGDPRAEKVYVFDIGSLSGERHGKQIEATAADQTITPAVEKFGYILHTDGRQGQERLYVSPGAGGSIYVYTQDEEGSLELENCVKTAFPGETPRPTTGNFATNGSQTLVTGHPAAPLASIQIHQEVELVACPATAPQATTTQSPEECLQ